MDKATLENKVLKNNISGIVHMAGDDEGTTCRRGMTADTLKNADSILNVYEAENVLQAFSKVTCKRCIRIMKPYMSAFAIYQ